MTESPTITIIHAPADALFAASIGTALQRQGYTVQSSTMMSTAEALSVMIRAAQVVLVVLSPAAARDPAFEAQWQEAFAARKPLIPLIAQPSAIPPALQLYQWIVFADRQNEALRDLLRVLPPIPQATLTPRRAQWPLVAMPVTILVIVVLLGVLLLHRPSSTTRPVAAFTPKPTVQTHGSATFTFLNQSTIPLALGRKTIIVQPSGVFTLLDWPNYMYQFDPKTDTNLVPLSLPSKQGSPTIWTMCVGPDGNVWYSDNFLGIMRINPGGDVTSFSLNGATALTLAAGTNNDLWFTTNPDTPQLGHITTSGTITYTPLPNIGYPYALVLAPDGSIWFDDLDTEIIYHRTLDGVFHAYTPSYRGGLGLIAFTPDGTAWIQEYDIRQAVNNAHNIIRITADGQLSEIPLNTGIADSDEHVNDLISGADGKLWFTSGKNIAALNPDGSYAHIYRLKYPANAPLYHDEIVQPDGIVQGRDGTIWVSSSFSHAFINLIP